MALDYRQSGIDYRNSGVTYQGVQDVTVTPATVAGVAAVPGATVAGAAVVTAGVVAGVGAVPSPSVSGTATVIPSAVAGVGAVPSATVSGTAAVTASTVAGVGAVPASTVTGTAAVTPDTVATVAACSSFTDITELFTSPTTDTLPNLAKGETDYQPLAAKNRLARFYAPRAKGGNVWILSDTTVTTTQPMTEADIATITRTLYGGHDYPDDLSETEAALLVAAGHTVGVEVR